ncbi:alcohol dehydrogenase [Endozoicomonas sp. OPT23]|uniref:phosphonoacetaldehyde reductase n=1 Tax=Endozoicomonas sp. OPT23 TaxID=2072845 RepID=UPI00129A37FC|nr:phosphonoacetaldehyde reductase [Endozoicomonas sp. OPT23]MRI31790.1 alcohol dehydrogenase [Endozoicomonas sp. OPT23]
MWTFSNPVSIYSGSGSLSVLKDLIGRRRYGVLTYRSDYFKQLTLRISGIIGREPDCIIDGVEENPSIPHLKHLCSRLQATEPSPEIIIALGGGSVIDACKAIAACSGEARELEELVLEASPIINPIPFICIPTTAGTGSEVTCWATVWNPENNKKHSLSAPSLYSEAAILDPDLTRTLPKRVAISSALDALSHALESLWNIHRNPISTNYALEAIKRIYQYLPQLNLETNADVAREELQLASTLAGLAFSNTRTAIAHNLSYAITLEKGTAHGIACSFTLPTILRANSEDRFMQSCTQQIFNSSCTDAADLLETFLTELDVSYDPNHYGYSETEWMLLIDSASKGQRGRNYSGDIAKLKLAFRHFYSTHNKKPRPANHHVPVI